MSMFNGKKQKNKPLSKLCHYRFTTVENDKIVKKKKKRKLDIQTLQLLRSGEEFTLGLQNN